MCNNLITRVTTGPPNGPVLFYLLASVVVCNAVGGRSGRPPGAWAVGRPIPHGGPVEWTEIAEVDIEGGRTKQGLTLQEWTNTTTLFICINS